MLNYWSKTIEKLNSYYDKIYVNKKYYEKNSSNNTDEDKTEFLKKQNELSDKIEELNKTIAIEIQKCLNVAFPEVKVLCIDTRMYNMDDNYIGNVLIEHIGQSSMIFELERWIECQLSIKVSITRFEDLNEDTQKIMREFLCQEEKNTMKTTI